MERSSSDLRDAIIRVSLELASEHGEDGLTIRGIAGRLDVSPTVLYQYFESKAAILQELRVYGVRRLGEEMIGALELDGVREAVLEASRRYVGFARENPWLYLILMQEGDAPTQVFNSDQLSAAAGIRDRLQSAITDKFAALLSEDPQRFSRFIAHWWAGLHGVAGLLIQGRIRADHPLLAIRDIDAFIEDYLERHVDCLMAREAKAG